MRRFATALVSTLSVWLLSIPGGHAQSPPTDAHGDPLPPGATARLGTLRYRHDSPIVFAAFAPDGKSVISVSSDGVACVWEFPSGKGLERLEMLGSAAGQVTGATLSPDGKHLTAFVDDGFMRIWDLAKAKELGKVAHAAAASGPVNPITGLVRPTARTTPASPPPVYSADGKTLMIASARVLQLVDLAAGKEVRPNLGHAGPLTGIWFTPDGTQIITKDAKATHAWNAATGKDLGATGSVVRMPPTTGTPTLISPDGRFGVTVARFASPALAQAAKSREAYLFDTATGKQLGVIELEVEVTPMHRKALAFSPDSKLLAAVAGDVTARIDLYEVPSGRLLRSLDTGLAGAGKGKGAAFALASNQRMLLSSDGTALAFQPGPGAAIVVLDVQTGRKLASLANADGNTVLQGTFSPDGRCLALEKSDGTVALYELATGQPRRTFGSELPREKGDPLDEIIGGFGGPGGAFFSTATSEKARAACAISPDGRLLALPGVGGVVRVFDTLTGKELQSLKGHMSTVNALAFSPSGKMLASASHDTTALIWDVTKITRPAPAAKAPRPGDLDSWWKALAGDDATKSIDAMAELASLPKDAVAWIKDHVKPATPLDSKRVDELIQQLGDEQFKIRAKASDELQKLGDLTLPAIDKALAGTPSPEAHKRLEELRTKLTGTGLEGERLRIFRAVEILELIATPEARQALQTLADGAPGALATTSAQKALKR